MLERCACKVLANFAKAVMLAALRRDADPGAEDVMARDK